jgi:DNA-directed RNA polymerase omega subunit
MKELPENVPSKYLFVTLAAQRCAQLLNGARPKIETKSMQKYTTVAMNEILDGHIEYTRGKKEEKAESIEPAGDNS